MVQCTQNGSLFSLQVCQPVQCNPMPPTKYISLMIRVGYVLRPNMLLQCMDGHSDDATAGCCTSLNAACPSDPSWTLSPYLAALLRHLPKVLLQQHLRSLTVWCTRVVTFVTLCLVTFPRLLEVSCTGVMTLSI